MQKAMTAAVVMALVVGLVGPAAAEEPGVVRESAMRLAAEAGAAQDGMMRGYRRSMTKTLAGIGLMAGGLALIQQTCRGFVTIHDTPEGRELARDLRGVPTPNGQDVCVAVSSQDGPTWNNWRTYAGIGLIGYGALITTIWANAPVDVRTDRHGVTVGRTVGW